MTEECINLSDTIFDQNEIDIKNGNYVTISSQVFQLPKDCNVVIHEHVITFSGQNLMRIRLCNASNAQAKECFQDSEEGLEE